MGFNFASINFCGKDVNCFLNLDIFDDKSHKVSSKIKDISENRYLSLQILNQRYCRSKIILNGADVDLIVAAYQFN